MNILAIDCLQYLWIITHGWSREKEIKHYFFFDKLLLIFMWKISLGRKHWFKWWEIDIKLHCVELFWTPSWSWSSDRLGLAQGIFLKSLLWVNKNQKIWLKNENYHFIWASLFFIASMHMFSQRTIFRSEKINL